MGKKRKAQKQSVPQAPAKAVKVGCGEGRYEQKTSAVLVEEKKAEFKLVKPTMVFTPKVASERPFDVDPRDHAESCFEAFQDIAPILSAIAARLGKTKGEVVIYDPYYCEGSCKKHLAELGFPNVINRNRDFYKDLAEGLIPTHDILVTGPPFSEDHMQKCLAFAHSQPSIPFFLLQPDFVATKPFFNTYVSQARTPPTFLGPIQRPYVFSAPLLGPDGKSPLLQNPRDLTKQTQDIGRVDYQLVTAGSYQCIWFMQLYDHATPILGHLLQAGPYQPREQYHNRHVIPASVADPTTTETTQETKAELPRVELPTACVKASAFDLPNLAPARGGRKSMTPAQRRWAKKVKALQAKGLPIPERAPAGGRDGQGNRSAAGHKKKPKKHVRNYTSARKRRRQ